MSTDSQSLRDSYRLNEWKEEENKNHYVRVCVCSTQCKYWQLRRFCQLSGNSAIYWTLVKQNVRRTRIIYVPSVSSHSNQWQLRSDVNRTVVWVSAKSLNSFASKQIIGLIWLDNPQMKAAFYSFGDLMNAKDAIFKEIPKRIFPHRVEWVKILKSIRNGMSVQRAVMSLCLQQLAPTLKY